MKLYLIEESIGSIEEVQANGKIYYEAFLNNGKSFNGTLHKKELRAADALAKHLKIPLHFVRREGE